MCMSALGFRSFGRVLSLYFLIKLIKNKKAVTFANNSPGHDREPVENGIINFDLTTSICWEEVRNLSGLKWDGS